MQPIYLTIREAAGLLRIGRSTIYRLIRKRDLAISKIGRRSLIARTELERFAASLATPVGPNA